jgi:DNA replication and repair protein RecF
MAKQIIDSLILKNIRSHTTAKFEFNSKVNAIVGLNGSGKTTLLESIYLMLLGKSFKGTAAEVIKWGETSALIEIKLKETENESFRRLSIELNDSNLMQKKWNVNNRKTSRLAMSDRLPAVLFEPEIGRMITGSPQKRRDYLDVLSSQIDIELARAQSRYERVLKQRNSLLKKLRNQTLTKPHLDQIFIYNTQLATLSEQIVKARHSLLAKLQNQITNQYKKLGGNDEVMLSYLTKVSDDPNNYSSKLLHFLEASLTRDIVLGYTSFGPHRDDMEVRLADQPAQERASRGEIRTIVLALKLLEAEILKEAYITYDILPILLFDDVLSELDLNHQEQILAGFKNYQVFLTTTDAHTLTPGTYTVALD